VGNAILLGMHYLAAAAALAAVPIMAAALHALLRPEDASVKRERDLRRRLIEEELYGGERCLECRTPVEDDWLRCPRCTAELRQACACGETLELHWSACPWCGAATDGPERAALAA
jgi:hypothetical protein